jgi:hypothetical protein
MDAVAQVLTHCGLGADWPQVDAAGRNTSAARTTTAKQRLNMIPPESRKDPGVSGFLIFLTVVYGGRPSIRNPDSLFF